MSDVGGILFAITYHYRNASLLDLAVTSSPVTWLFCLCSVKGDFLPW